MPNSKDALERRLDHLIWTIIAVIAVAVLAAPFFSNFYIEVETFGAPLGACLTLAAGAWFYRRWRPDPKLSAGLESTAQVVAFAAVGAPLSYLAAAADLPLRDHAFDAIDHALGLDWMVLLDWMNQHVSLYSALRPIYLSLTLQMSVTVLCLAFSGRLLRLRVYTLAFVLATLVTIGLSVLLPASGVWPHHGLTAAASPHIMPAVNTSWPVFFGLRSGSFRALVAIGSEGIITFPSLHAALAVILIAALWPVPALRWAVLGLNLAMLVATPIDGSHYFIDVIAGIAIGILAFVAARAIAARNDRTAISLPAGKLPQLVAGE